MEVYYWNLSLYGNGYWRFQSKRLPKARVIASDILQKLDSVYMALPGVIGIVDIIVYGRAELEHDGNLILFLKTTRKNELWLNKDKLSI